MSSRGFRPIYQVIAVDGHSVDDTLTVARQLRPDVRIIRQTRKGKGNALACGFAAATGDIIAAFDADSSADPGEIPRFVEALINGADFAKGTRCGFNAGSSDLARLRSLRNRVLSFVVKMCYGIRYTELCYGFDVLWRRHVPVLRLDAASPSPPNGEWLHGDGFEVEMLIDICVAAARLEISEVPSFEHPRVHGASNLSAVKDGWRVLKVIVRERFGVSYRTRFGGSLGRSAVHAPPAGVSIAAVIEAAAEKEGM